MAAEDTKTIYVKNGRVTAVLLPGEGGTVSYGVPTAIPADTKIGVGDQWPVPEPVAAPAKKTATKKAAAAATATAEPAVAETPAAPADGTVPAPATQAEVAA